jgi:alkanesulfonate monooxygenase SsuD/methylene tetrahydromethanopterin reductase-like flavin-dependent oxidoreductase (luciferase family)
VGRKTGVYIEPRRGTASVDARVHIERARLVEQLGVESIWTSQIVDAHDACTLLSAYSVATERVGLGVAVIPVYLRHPVSTIQMAATLDEISGGRFRLGLGVGSQLTVEWILGATQGDPLEATREYVSIVRSGLETGSVNFTGRHFSARWKYIAQPRPKLPVMLGAMGPKMLELAGEIADGVVLWMCTADYLRDQVMPRLKAGRARAGKTLDGFEVQACMYISLTSNPACARQYIKEHLQYYTKLPTYQRFFTAIGFGDDIANGALSDRFADSVGGIGDELEVRCAIEAFRDAGCTLPMLAVLPEHDGSADFATALQVAMS